MESGNNKNQNQSDDYKLFRFAVPYSDTVDLAKKILTMYNSHIRSTSGEAPIDDRHLNLLSYYFVFGYSNETKKKFAHCFSVEVQYASVLDTELKRRGILVDPDGTYRSRRLSDDIENLRRLFITDNHKDRCACVFLFYRDNLFNRSGEEGEEKE